MAVPAVATFLGRRLALGTVFSALIDNERIFTTARAVPPVGFIAAVQLDPTQAVRPNLACSSLLSDSGSSVLHLLSYCLKQMSRLPFSPYRAGKWERGGREGGNPSIDPAAGQGARNQKCPERTTQSLREITRGPIRIIIADDHAIFRDGLRRLLMTQEDFEVVAEAMDGSEAVSLTEELRPDILLLDLTMPKVPGMETLRRLAYDATPVYTILLTAAIHPLEITHALRLGARGVVLKASPPEVLLKSIRSVCEGGYWVDDELLAGWGRFGDEAKNRSELTPREVEIISEIKAGRSNREIAHKLSISDETVKRHLSNIFEKLGVSSRLELALLASKHDLSP